MNCQNITKSFNVSGVHLGYNHNAFNKKIIITQIDTRKSRIEGSSEALETEF